MNILHFIYVIHKQFCIRKYCKLSNHIFHEKIFYEFFFKKLNENLYVYLLYMHRPLKKLQ
jgi:hypothetical protein